MVICAYYSTHRSLRQEESLPFGQFAGTTVVGTDGFSFRRTPAYDTPPGTFGVPGKLFPIIGLIASLHEDAPLYRGCPKGTQIIPFFRCQQKPTEFAAEFGYYSQ